MSNRLPVPSAEFCAAAVAEAQASVSVLRALPFTRQTSDQLDYWRVPMARTYGQACKAGAEFGAAFLRLVERGEARAGFSTLGQIAAAIDFTDRSDSKGYWVGFFNRIERALAGADERGEHAARGARGHWPTPPAGQHFIGRGATQG